MRIATVFFIVLALIGANAAQAQPFAVPRSIQVKHTAAVGLDPVNAVVPRGSGSQALATGLQGTALPITERVPLHDLKLARMQECKARPRRVALGATLGLLGGTAIGLAYGAAGHPGLPHIGGDVPTQ